MKTLASPTLTKPRTQSKILEQIETIEEYLQTLKGELYWMPVKVRTKESPKSIVEQTAGILNKKNINGVQYENKTRKKWSNRLAKI